MNPLFLALLLAYTLGFLSAYLYLFLWAAVQS